MSITYTSLLERRAGGGGGGGGGSNTALAAPLTPNVIAGDTTNSISWVPQPQTMYFNVYRSTAPGSVGTLVGFHVATIHYTDTGLSNGTTYYYEVTSVNGNGEGPATAQVSATPVHLAPLIGTVQANINSTPLNGTLTIPAATIGREAPIGIPRAMSIVFQPGSGLRGSDVWPTSFWNDNGNGTWTSTQTIPNLAVTNGASNARQPYYGLPFDGLNIRGEQVFRDLVQLRSMPHGTRPASGQFAQLSDTDFRLMIADTPVGHTMEVTTRQQIMSTGTAGVTIVGGDFRHCANDTGDNVGMMDFHANNTVLRDGVYKDSHAAAIGCQSNDSSLILRCEVVGGQLGLALGGTGDSNLVLRGCDIHNCNQSEYNSAWEAGGFKISVSRTSTVEYCWSHDNDGIALWWDIDNQQTTSRYNRCWNNNDNGMQYEVSPGSTTNASAPIITTITYIYGNVMFNNSRQTPAFGGVCEQFSITGSHHVEAYNNVCYNNAAFNGTPYTADGFFLQWYDRTGQADNNPNGAGTNLNIHDNQGGGALNLTDWSGTPAPGSSGNVDLRNTTLTGTALANMKLANGIP